MTGEVYVVAASGLNMRELPDAGSEILVVLPKGQFVTRLDNKAWGGSWFRVQAELHMMAFQGYVSGAYLTPLNPPPASKPSLNVTEANIIALAKNPKRDFLPGLVTGFNRELPAYQINTGLRLSHFMAQCAHECDNFRTMEEYASGAAYEGRVTGLGNTQPGDGVRYKGRGIIQLTGRNNYRIYGAALGLDLENNPQLASVPQNAVKVACEYWKKNNLNALADADNIEAITRRINGGLNGLADRQLKLRIAKSIWGGAPGA